MDTLDYIINMSGDSELENYTYAEGVLTIILDVTEIEKKVKISIRTNDVTFNNVLILSNNGVFRTCRIELVELINVLSSENSCYVPSKDFGKMMKESRMKLNLAYGKKLTEVRYIFSLLGYDRIIACLISDVASITIADVPSGEAFS
ncbi:MAG: hypothetical protein U0264_10650 [Candidatus Kapaibacterium sp.]